MNFIKKIVKNFLFHKLTAKILVKPAMQLHSLLYNLIGMWVTVINNGGHPKHNIIRYQDWFLEQIDHQSNIIDIGCNKGYMVHYLSKKCCFAYGIELNPKLFDFAQANYKKQNIKFINADATTFNYSSLKPIDFACLSNVLEHIEDRVSFLKSLKEKINWKNEINFLIRVPTIERDWLSVYKKQEGIKYLLDRTHFIEHTQEDFYKEIKLSGLTIKSYNVRFGEIFAVVGQ